MVILKFGENPVSQIYWGKATDVCVQQLKILNEIYSSFSTSQRSKIDNEKYPFSANGVRSVKFNDIRPLSRRYG